MDKDTFSNDNIRISAGLFSTLDIESSTSEDEKETIKNHFIKGEHHAASFLEIETISNNDTFEELTTVSTASGKL